MKQGLLIVATVLAGLGTAPRPPVGQASTVDLRGFAPCSRCRLQMDEVARFGEPSGDGMIESERSTVFFSESLKVFALYAEGRSRISLYDERGTYMRTIGRSGNGPDEIRQIWDAHFNGPSIIVADRNNKLVRMDMRGSVLGTASLHFEVGTFRVASESTLVMARMIQSRALVGYPLHLINEETGEVLAHFGSVDGDWSASEPYADIVVLGWSPNPSSIWRGQVTRLQLEEWSLDNRLLRTVSGDLNWFAKSLAEIGGPRTVLVSFGTDTSQRLYTLVQIPDPQWRTVPQHGDERYVLSDDLEHWYDIRLDVFDLVHKRHLGTATWSDPNVRLVQVGGRVVVQRIVYDERDVPRVALFNVHSGSGNSRTLRQFIRLSSM